MNQNIKIEKEFSAIILAAGKSERLGFPKLSLKYDNNQIFIEHIVNEYLEFGCKEIVLVINDIGFVYLKQNEIQFPDQVKLVTNEHPDWQRFYSLKVGAKSLSKIQPAFIHNVDNPYVNHGSLSVLLNQLEIADYINPEYEGKGGHPFLISGKIIQDLQASKLDQIHLKEFLNQFPNIKVKVADDKILVNINTLEEYRKYFSF